MPPRPLEGMAAAQYPLRLFLDEESGGTPLVKSLQDTKDCNTVSILIGPEGGWTDGERERLQASWSRVSLGSQILRAETAAVAGLALVMNLLA